MITRLLNDLPNRARLTVQEHGWKTLLMRFLTAPLRPLGLEHGVRGKWHRSREAAAVRKWFAANARPVTIVIPTYGDPGLTFDAVAKLRDTSPQARIVVVDDGSEARHQQRLGQLEGAEVVLADTNRGYAVSANLGIAQARPGDDVVVLNNDVLARKGWLAHLQHAAYSSPEIGIVGPRLLYPDGRIQSAGSYRNLSAPEWFDHRYRFRPGDYGPAGVATDVLAVTGACMYLRRDLIDTLEGFDEGYGMGFEDVDLCLRCWGAGRSVRYEPGSVLTHVESPTRGTEVGEREQASQERFWATWGSWFDDRPVTTADGALRVIYVTEGTDVGGGHRDIFEHVNRLAARGHDVSLYSLGGQPEWFPLDVAVRTFASYDELAVALADQDAIKIATWWATGEAVWRGSLRRGRPAFFVQDIETSYYPGRDHKAQEGRDRVLAGYREEFAYMTISQCNDERLRELGVGAEIVPPGIDLDTFRGLDATERERDVVLAIGRGNPLKNFPLTVAAWQRLEPRPELRLFGVEPETAAELDGVSYVEGPSDEGVNELFNQAAVFVQTSVHEGFCLPPLEAMASGTPVVCTDAHGNRDFCRDGENCLMPEPDAESVAEALRRVLSDPELRRTLAAGGLATVGEYAWPRRIEELERFLWGVAGGAPDGEPVGDATGDRPARR